MRAVVTKFPTRTVPDHAYKTAVHTVPSFRAPYRSRGKGIYLSIHPPMPCWLLYFCRAVLVPRCMWFDKKKTFFQWSKHSALVREARQHISILQKHGSALRCTLQIAVCMRCGSFSSLLFSLSYSTGVCCAHTLLHLSRARLLLSQSIFPVREAAALTRHGEGGD